MEQTAGEFLADLAASVGGSRVVACDAGELSREGIDRSLAIVRLALVLKRHPVLQLRAIVEEWDVPRIVRELY